MDGEERWMIQGRSCHVLNSGRPSLFCHHICSGPFRGLPSVGLCFEAHVKTARREGGAPRYVPSRIWLGIFHGPRLNVMGNEWLAVSGSDIMSYFLMSHLHHDSVNFFALLVPDPTLLYD